MCVQLGSDNLILIINPVSYDTGAKSEGSFQHKA